MYISRYTVGKQINRYRILVVLISTNWTEQDWGPEASSYECGNEPLGYIKDEELPDLVSNN
jgi:hypothetical protein